MKYLLSSVLLLKLSASLASQAVIFDDPSDAWSTGKTAEHDAEPESCFHNWVGHNREKGVIYVEDSHIHVIPTPWHNGGLFFGCAEKDSNWNCVKSCFDDGTFGANPTFSSYTHLTFQVKVSGRKEGCQPSVSLTKRWPMYESNVVDLSGSYVEGGTLKDSEYQTVLIPTEAFATEEWPTLDGVKNLWFRTCGDYDLVYDVKNVALTSDQPALAATSATDAAPFEYTDGPVIIDGDAVSFRSTSGQDATFLTTKSYGGDLAIEVEYMEREAFGEGYQAGLTLFFAKPEDGLDTLTTNDNGFETFEQTSVASVRDKLYPSMDYVWFELKNLGLDGSLVKTPQYQSKGKMTTGGRFKLVRTGGFVTAYHHKDGAWTQIGSNQELPDAYKTSPLKIGMRIKREWKSKYALKVAPTISHDGTQVPVGDKTSVRAGSVPSTKASGSASGDPHFKTWTGDKYDYHGECDLVLLDNPAFADGLGLRVHIRTTRVRYFSFIEKVAIQIGEDVMEFSNDVDTFLINGILAEVNKKHHRTFLGGYLVRRDSKSLSIRLQEGHGAKIDLHMRKNGFPAVVVDGGNTAIFNGSLGLFGDWKTGKRLARDGETELGDKDATAFALEWQVRDTEPMLFEEARFPQFPTTCTPPEKMPNRLGMVSMEKEAKKACAHWKEDKDECIFDVMATRSIAGAEEPLAY